MVTELIPRNAAKLAHEILQDTPVLSVTGGRQVGKSTLVRQLLADRPSTLINLDNSVALAAAQADPDGFISQFPQGTLAIDEIQRAPELFRAIKAALEEDRRPGRFIITGSSNLLTLQGAQESLAGRAESLHLRGLSMGEKLGITEDFIAFAFGLDSGSPLTIPSPQPLGRRDYLELVSHTAFPEIVESTHHRRDRWVTAYLERVLTKDASYLFNLHYPDRLRVIVEALAAAGTTEFVAARFARELDIPERTIPSYIKALASVFLIDSLPAWGINLAKRVVSKPKVFLRDPGMAVSLTGLDPTAMEAQISSAFTGGIIESFVAAELLKQQTWSTVDFRLYHFRDSNGKEVDLIAENRRREIVAMEVKATTSLNSGVFKGLKHLQSLVGDRFVAGIVFYTGKDIFPMGKNLWAMPISTLWAV